MNIFATSSCPYESAIALDDKRVVKMTLETAQILSTAIYKKDPLFHYRHNLYKPTHQNHPCTLWVGANSNHYHWTYHHFLGLLQEYTARYGRTHACAKFVDIFAIFLKEELFTSPPKYFVNCSSEKEIDDIHLAYKICLADKWEADKRVPTWYGVKR